MDAVLFFFNQRFKQLLKFHGKNTKSIVSLQLHSRLEMQNSAINNNVIYTQAKFNVVEIFSFTPQVPSGRSLGEGLFGKTLILAIGANMEAS